MSELASTIVSVITSDSEDNINTNLHVAFSVSRSSDQCLKPIFDVTFCKAINLRAEVTMFILNLSQYSILISLTFPNGRN